MRRLLYFILAAFANLYAHAQYEWQWGFQFPENESLEVMTAMAYDGGFILAGSFQDSLVFGNNTLISNGRRDVFLLKIDTNGNIVKAVSFGEVEDDTPSDMTLSEGTILLLGQSSDGNAHSLFVLFMDAELVFQKRLSFPFSGTICSDFLHSSKDMLVVGGSLKGILQTGIATIGDNRAEHAFFAVFNTDGEPMDTWITEGNSNNRLHSMTANGHGGYSLLLNTGKGTLRVPQMDPFSLKNNEVILIHLDSLWNPVWVQEASTDGFMETTAAATDSLGITVAINYTNTISLGKEHFTSTGGLSALLLHYSWNGEKKWSAELKSDEYCRLTDVKKNDNNLFCTGYYYGTLSIEDVILGQSSERSAFLAGFDNTGDLFLNTDTGRSDPNTSLKMACDMETILLAGTYKKQINRAYTDMFSIGKEEREIVVDTIKKTIADERNTRKKVTNNENKVSSWRFFPNPVKSVLYWSTDSTETWSMELFDIQGKLLWQAEIAHPDSGCTDLSSLAPGIYTLTVSSSKRHISQRILKY